MSNAETTMSTAMANAQAKKGKTSSNKPANPARVQRFNQAVERRVTYTLERAVALSPSDGQAEQLSATFGLDPVDFHAARETTEECLVQIGNELVDHLNTRAMQLVLQPIVGSFVGAACRSGQFYSDKVSQAREATMALANDDRDEDRDGPSGFESKAARAREFAAIAGLQAYAVLAAATGAVHAYASIVGEDWKPYEAAVSSPATVSRRSATEEMSAFG